jgi:hypothetical protein
MGVAKNALRLDRIIEVSKIKTTAAALLGKGQDFV